MPAANANAVPSASEVYIIFDIGRTWRHMSASVREVLSDHLIILYMTTPFKSSDIVSDRFSLTV
jgi:hypothetical protein